jgi:hypothetical protein
MIVFGFGNKARQGKDTAAAAIIDYCKEFHEPAHRIAFADALRCEVTEAIRKVGSGEVELLLAKGPEPGVEFPSWVVPTENPDMTDPLLPYGKHNKLLQWWGTDYRRVQDPDYWVKQWLTKVKALPESAIVFAPDTRFINEALAVASLGGYTVNVSRLNEDGSPYFSSDRPRNHQSEIELDGWDWDFRIVAKSGQVELVNSMALAVFRYVLWYGKD